MCGASGADETCAAGALPGRRLQNLTESKWQHSVQWPLTSRTPCFQLDVLDSEGADPGGGGGAGFVGA
eukprot:6438957-Pyramimonas_sp.AAC.1